MALDTSNNPVLGRETPVGQVERQYWAVNGTTNDSGSSELRAAPGAGLSLYIEEVLITTATGAVLPALLAGAVTLFGPFYTQTYGWILHKIFKRPLRVPANTALNLFLGTANWVSIYIEGYTE